MPGRMEAEYGSWAPACGSAWQHRGATSRLADPGDSMPDWADLHCNEVIQLVPPVRGGGQAEPAPRWELLYGILEGGGWHWGCPAFDGQG